MKAWAEGLIKPKERWIWFLRIFWILVFALFVILLCRPETSESSGITTLSELKIYSGGSKERVALWDRGKAVEFGFSQVATLINYLFVAAAATLGFVSKVLIDPVVKPEKHKLILPPTSTLLRHTAIGCLFSMFYGFMGATYIAQIPDSVSFSIYEEVGAGAACQQISFLFAAVLMVVAIAYMLKNQNSG